MKEEMETIKLRSGNQLARENYLLLNKSKAQILNILLNTEEKMEDLQSQLKAKEEVIQNARLWINRKIKSCTIEATSTTTNDICKITLFSLNKLDEILSKGENK